MKLFGSLSLRWNIARVASPLIFALVAVSI